MEYYISCKYCEKMKVYLGKIESEGFIKPNKSIPPISKERLEGKVEDDEVLIEADKKERKEITQERFLEIMKFKLNNGEDYKEVKE